MGSQGIVCPFVNTPEEAVRGARACRYPPAGNRGWGPHRAARYGLMEAREYTDAMVDQVVYIPIIESAKAVDNIAAILAVEGVDSFLVGPVDLSISLGVPFAYDSVPFQDAMQKVLDAARRADKPAGGASYGSIFSEEGYKKQIEAGFRLFLAGGDEPILAGACRHVLDNLSALRD